MKLLTLFASATLLFSAAFASDSEPSFEFSSEYVEYTISFDDSDDEITIERPQNWDGGFIDEEHNQLYDLEFFNGQKRCVIYLGGYDEPNVEASLYEGLSTILSDLYPDQDTIEYELNLIPEFSFLRTAFQLPESHLYSCISLQCVDGYIVAVVVEGVEQETLADDSDLFFSHIYLTEGD